MKNRDKRLLRIVLPSTQYITNIARPVASCYSPYLRSQENKAGALPGYSTSMVVQDPFR